ncbi:uncharacterized protein LOC126895898 [Daktulosphaira vitifoliae]|uniref:uncharacterized protein LOC126895898 n=1 Tax=Daktulosphaira vitifoliae TaxID=58002 RepID=UPI0021A9A1C5|nr:uncharacterized protein LOC126895898 [Daktulosphaira vitifoliae]
MKKNDFPSIITDPAVISFLISSGSTQPRGPFPKDDKQNNRCFSENYYSVITKSGLRIVQNWLSYSEKNDVIYCLPCWLFPQKRSFENPFGTCGISDWKHLSERVKSNETSECHKNSCTVYEMWRKKGTIDIVSVEILRKERMFWRKVLERILDVTMILATCNLAFRGSSDKIEDLNKGNFLSIIALLAKYDPVMSELLAKSAGSTKYLSHHIQNEIICLLT